MSIRNRIPLLAAWAMLAALALGFGGQPVHAAGKGLSGPARTAPAQTDPATRPATATGRITYAFTARTGMGESWPQPVLEVFENGTLVLTHVFAGSGWDDPPFEAEEVELDEANETPEILASAFTGGAHCCHEVAIAVKQPDGSWTALEMGLFDGGVGTLDADGDGRKELISVDQTFLYAFGCYACSLSPPVLHAVAQGSLADVSAEPRYQPFFATWVTENAQDPNSLDPDTGNAFLAGWVAGMARAGQFERGWEIIQRYHNPKSDWDYTICRAYDADGICYPNASISVPFPDALRAHLLKQGYIQ